MYFWNMKSFRHFVCTSNPWTDIPGRAKRRESEMAEFVFGIKSPVYDNKTTMTLDDTVRNQIQLNQAG